jgi:hypothetical protein
MDPNKKIGFFPRNKSQSETLQENGPSQLERTQKAYIQAVRAIFQNQARISMKLTSLCWAAISQ